MTALLVSISSPSVAQTRYIVRDSLGLLGINSTCSLLGCSVVRTLDGTVNQLFLIELPSVLDPAQFLLSLVSSVGVVDVEPEQVTFIPPANAGSVPSYLTDETIVNYYGAPVWEGYTIQPATQIIHLPQMRATYGLAGAGVTVALIDTGIDPNHPALQPWIVQGYDFTRNTAGADETGDVNQSTAGVLDSASPAQVNQSEIAVVNQSTAGVLDGGPYSAYGHGTMTAGIVHLVAPQAQLMPLKAFGANGTGVASDVLRSIYYAAQHGARVMNMSFSFSSPSPELQRAINYAAQQNVISVASAGNDGQAIRVYPAGYNNVIDVASTSNQDTQSSFTNYGAPPVWLPAPGEGIMSTYPGSTYAVGWGTSFSAPFVTGTAALLAATSSSCNQSRAATALSNGDWISAPQLGHGRLNVYSAAQAGCRSSWLW
ncbi:MAG TPA: S8 family serine peptidase [Terriglobales bacterium]